MSQVFNVLAFLYIDKLKASVTTGSLGTNTVYILIILFIATSLLRKLIPNQELSVLYGGLSLNYGGQLPLCVPHMLRVNMTRDLAHLQLSHLQVESRPICRTFDLQGERMLICRTQ